MKTFNRNLYQKLENSGLTRIDIAKQFGLPIQTFYRKLKKNKLFFKRPFHPNPFTPIFSSQLSYICGVLLGDGSVYKYQRKKSKKWVYFLSLTVRNQSFAQEFANILSKIFKRKMKVFKISLKTGRIFYRVITASKEFFEWFQTKEKFKITKLFPKEFIQGFYDSEGSCTYNHRKYKLKIYTYYMFRLSNSDYYLLELIKKLLISSFGVKSKIYILKTVKSKMLDGHWLIPTKNIYNLTVSQHDNDKFIELISDRRWSYEGLVHEVQKASRDERSQRSKNEKWK